MAGVGRGPGRGEPSIEPCSDAAAPGARQTRNSNSPWPHILLAFLYAENAFNHNGRFDPGVKLLRMSAPSCRQAPPGAR